LHGSDHFSSAAKRFLFLFLSLDTWLVGERNTLKEIRAIKGSLSGDLGLKYAQIANQRKLKVHQILLAAGITGMHMVQSYFNAENANGILVFNGTRPVHINLFWYHPPPP